jgi:hypothetical protein
VTTFSTYLSPDDALARIIDEADAIEALVKTRGPGDAERQGQIRIAAGRIKDYARVLSGDAARGVVLEDSESALKAVIDSRPPADEDA